MPGKSRHGRQSKKKKYRLGSSAIAAQKPEITQPHESVAPAKVSAPPATAPTPMPATRYPYVATELRRIGILAGMTLVILIVLALVFS